VLPNDKLTVGQKKHDDTIPLLIRFRQHAIPLIPNVAKTCHQVKVQRKDTNIQRIVWQEDPKQPISGYRLLTVTHGTTAASYAATRHLQQLAREENEAFPVAATAGLQDFFVNDPIYGAQS
jgi:hypothetical protein